MATHRLRIRDVSYLKPEGFENYMTITEVARKVNRDITWLRYLEKHDRIPKASRFNGSRLWSPEQVDEIAMVISKSKVGRPRKNG